MTDVHPFIKPAVTAAVAETLGTTVNEQGQLEVPPNVAAFYARYQQLEATVETLQETVVVYGTTITQQATTITQQADLITQLNSSVNSKANASTVSTLSQRVTTLSTTVDAKADANAVSQQFQAVAGIDSGQATAIAAVQQALVSEDGIFQGLLTTVGQHTGLLGGLRTDVDSKAPSTTVSNLSGRVTTLNSTVSDGTTGLAATYTLASAAKSTADTAKSTADVASTTAGSAKTAADAAATGLAATNSSVSSLSSTVNNATTGLAATNTLASSANANANTRLLRAGDTSTGNQSVPNPSTAAHAVPLGWLAGGVAQPFRFFTNVATTPVAVDDITNPFPAGTYVLWIDRIALILSQQPTANTTLTITATVSGTTTTIFTKTMVLASLAPVNNILEVLTLASTPLPITTALPATLKASLTGGAIGTIILAGKLQKTA